MERLLQNQVKFGLQKGEKIRNLLNIGENDAFGVEREPYLRSGLKFLLLAALMAGLTGVGAMIRIPMIPVPITLQTFFVLLAGGVLGPSWGMISMLIYLSLGLIGLPVFAGGSGVSVIFAPTFGYLLGFPLAAFYVGKKISVKINTGAWLKIWLHLLLGLLLVYFLGVVYLWLIKNFYIGEQFPISQAVLLGFILFLPGLLIKSLLALLVLLRLRASLKSIMVIF